MLTTPEVLHEKVVKGKRWENMVAHGWMISIDKKLWLSI